MTDPSPDAPFPFLPDPGPGSPGPGTRSGIERENRPLGGSGTRSPAPRRWTEEDGAPPSILLVEDEDAVRKVTSRLLERLGYRVISSPSGEDAHSLFTAAQGRFDLVVTDVLMPGMTGIELAEKLRAAEPETRILFISGYTSREFGAAPERPPNPFLPKPFSLEELAEKVREALER